MHEINDTHRLDERRGINIYVIASFRLQNTYIIRNMFYLKLYTQYAL